MKRLVLLVPLLLASCAVPPHAPPPQEPVAPQVFEAVSPPAAATALKGDWREFMNENNPVGGNKQWVFSDGTITIRDGARVFSGTFTCADDRDPKEIDIQFEGYPVNKGIYKLDGNILSVKVLDTAVERAKRFGIEGGYISIMCERAKEEPKP
jgi:uncharacterized protein (TIGR03067 family)